MIVYLAGEGQGLKEESRMIKYIREYNRLYSFMSKRRVTFTINKIRRLNDKNGHSKHTHKG